jgi:predicted ATPase/DNA-binding CsgD family transcriptional regulator
MAERAARRRLGNLPAELTSFVGRRRELTEIKRLLSTTRLLTLTGSGGAGKTRLALRAASEVARNFSDGVWLVALAPLDDPLHITRSVFSALGLQDVSSRWAPAALIDYLRDKHLLLILDNCEHMLDGAAGLAGTLLKACPELRILATSRRALGMAGEVRLRVPPLSQPDPSEPLSPGRIAASDAAALLIERAGAIQPGFAVDESNAALILQLCTRLDGMPLALELAAVRLEGLTLDQLLAGLDRHLAATDAELRGGEARQRTMQATLDWSHSLLDERQRLLWARLSVFAGGFDQAAAMTVCSGTEFSDEDLLSALAGLVESSIVQRDIGVIPVRYSMLETVRFYGREKLQQLGEELQLRTRHRKWVQELARSIQSWNRGEAEGFERVHLNRDDVWTALEFCRRHEGETGNGIDIALFLTNYWMSRGPLQDVRRYFEAVLPMTKPDTLIRARCLTGVALFADVLDDATAAQASGEESRRISEELGAAEQAGWACGSLLFAAFVRGARDGVAALSRSMIECGRATGSEAMVAIALHYTCLNLVGQGKLDEAVAVGEEGLDMCRQAENLFVRGTIVNSLAEARRRRGELVEAEALVREGIDCKHRLDDRRGLATLIETLAWIASDQRNHERAATLLGCAKSLRDAMAIRILAPFVTQHQACEQVTREHLGEARYVTALTRGERWSVVDAVEFAQGRAQAKPVVGAPPAKATPSALSRRELEIARLIAEGLTNREVAAKLFISNRTVETHVTNMLNKLGLSSRLQLARWVE